MTAASPLSTLRRSRPTSLRAPAPRLPRTVLAPALVAVLVLVCWSVSAAWADSAVYPSPIESSKGMWSDLRHPRFRSNLQSSVLLLVLTYASVVSLGIMSGLLVGLSRFWASVILPLAHAFNGIPRIVFFPVFLLILGSGPPSLAGFAFACGVIPMFLISAEATTAVSRLHLKLAASLGMRRALLLRKIVIPSIVPALVSGMRITFGLTFVGLLIAELFAASTGLGAEILRAIGQVRMGNILGQVVLIALIAVLPTIALRRLETRITRRYASST